LTFSHTRLKQCRAWRTPVVAFLEGLRFESMPKHCYDVAHHILTTLQYFLNYLKFLVASSTNRFNSILNVLFPFASKTLLITTLLIAIINATYYRYVFIYCYKQSHLLVKSVISNVIINNVTRIKCYE
jgi:hypothetical protein